MSAFSEDDRLQWPREAEMRSNMSSVKLNSSHIDHDLYQKYDKNRSVSDSAYWIILISYSILIVVGTLGNLLVIIAVANNKGMRTARNIFITTLAIADSSLCLFAMPITLIGVVTKYWPFGTQTTLLCKMMRTTPAVTIFFSSYTVVVIAVDRHRFIVNSTQRQVSSKEALWTAAGVLLFSVIISTPFTIYSELKIMFPDPGAYDHISFCVEDLPQVGQALLSLSVVIVQYLLPCAIVTVCYVSICRYLSSRPLITSTARQRRMQTKRKRNNRMLIAVTITHFMSWLPLNVINVIMTTLDSEEEPLFYNVEHLFITYAVCHLASMTSAISNPILYGFMNENFRGEFAKIWSKSKKMMGIKNGVNHGSAGDETVPNGNDIPLCSMKRPRPSEALITVGESGVDDDNNAVDIIENPTPPANVQEQVQQAEEEDRKF